MNTDIDLFVSVTETSVSGSGSRRFFGQKSQNPTRIGRAKALPSPIRARILSAMSFIGA